MPKSNLIESYLMRAPNGMWMITVGTLTGPWHVASRTRRVQPMVYKDHWCIVNIITWSSKVIGPVRMRGVNYHDRAIEVARERNEEFFRKHLKELPTFLGRYPEFDKVIAMMLAEYTEGSSAQEIFNKQRGL
jgi:hypothetical protein